MAHCTICGKKRVIGNNVSHANNRTKRVVHPNIQRVRVTTPNGVKRVSVCTRCIRSNKVTKVS